MSEALYCECDIDLHGHQPHCLVGAVYEVAEELSLLRQEAIEDLKNKVQNIADTLVTIDSQMS